MSAPVTVKAKCYPHVFVCQACRRLDYSWRSDAVTCSNACRVRWHRSPERARVVEMLKQPFFEGVTVAMLARSIAMKELRPDLAERVLAGEDPEAFRGEFFRAYWERLQRAAQMIEPTP